ncbi:MAG: folylpolyglutamate synthase/dihydrofolate synthase family protein [Candidatus Micrarchaeota archaeon]
MKKLEKALKQDMKLGLSRIEKLLKLWGNPQEDYKVILITGTNGKGSVTAYLASILKEEGYKVGSYFSPHLKKYNERIRINGKEISDKTFSKYESEVLAYAKKNKNNITLFEALTAVAYKYFSDEKCDFAVMEIGLGGRQDATNVAQEAISIITNIELDHTNRLGKTIDEIAYEKTGIMKKGLCITGTKGRGLDVIKENATKLGIPLKIFNEDFYIKTKEYNNKHGLFEFVGHEFHDNLEIKLLGRHQTKNASLAVIAAEELGVSEEAIRKGLLATKNSGRLEIIGKNPLLVIDGAHNPNGIGELIGNLHIFNYDKLIIVFGVMKDKNWQEMVHLLAPQADLFICTQIKTERCERVKNVLKLAKNYTEAIAIEDCKKALKEAKKKAKKKDMILVCGSIYLLGEMF